MKLHAVMTAVLLGIIAPSGATGRVCELSAIDGADAEIWSEGTWRTAEIGPLTIDNAVLRTGRSTRAEIRCADGLIVTIGIGTELTLETMLAPDSADMLLMLYRGILGLVAPPPREGGTAVLGPLAIAAARSTEWLVIVEPSGDTAAFVRAGQIEVTPIGVPGVPAMLESGEGRDVRHDGAGPVVSWGAARIAAAGEALGFGWR
jgi:hypothetical protein